MVVTATAEIVAIHIKALSKMGVFSDFDIGMNEERSLFEKYAGKPLTWA